MELTAEMTMEDGTDGEAFLARIGAVQIDTKVGRLSTGASLQVWNVALPERKGGPEDGPFRELVDSETKVLARVGDNFRDEYEAYRAAELMARARKVPIIDCCGPELDGRLPDGCNFVENLERMAPR